MIAGVLELSWRDIRELRVTDPYSVHRVIYSLFPDERTPEQKNAHQPAGFLYADKGGDKVSRRICFSQTGNHWSRHTAQCALGAFRTNFCSTMHTRLRSSSTPPGGR